MVEAPYTPDLTTIPSHVVLGREVRIGAHSTLGARHVRLNSEHSTMTSSAEGTRVGDGTFIGNYVLVYEGVDLGERVFLDDFTRVGRGSRVGPRSMLLYGAKVYDNVVIGADCRVAGLVPTRVVMGDRVTMMGFIAHKYARPIDWSADEPSPVFEDDVVAGMNSTIVGGITLGAGSYVAAGAIVTKDVPEDSFVWGINEVVPLREGPPGARR